MTSQSRQKSHFLTILKYCQTLTSILRLKVNGNRNVTVGRFEWPSNLTFICRTPFFHTSYEQPGIWISILGVFLQFFAIFSPIFEKLNTLWSRDQGKTAGNVTTHHVLVILRRISVYMEVIGFSDGLKFVKTAKKQQFLAKKRIFDHKLVPMSSKIWNFHIFY